MSEFQPFVKIARLSREMVVTEKIDGTNAQIEITPRGMAIDAPVALTSSGDLLMFAGSRSKWLTPGKDDNFGFARWVADHAAELWTLGEGRHYGEWWGSGIQRGYALPQGEKRFSLFNVARWADERDREKFPIDRPACCHVVPVLHRGVFDTAVIGTQIERLRELGSVAAPGFLKPEGVVVFHTAGSVLFKKTLDKDDEYKGQR